MLCWLCGCASTPQQPSNIHRAAVYFYIKAAVLRQICLDETLALRPVIASSLAFHLIFWLLAAAAAALVHLPSCFIRLLFKSLFCLFNFFSPPSFSAHYSFLLRLFPKAEGCGRGGGPAAENSNSYNYSSDVPRKRRNFKHWCDVKKNCIDLKVVSSHVAEKFTLTGSDFLTVPRVNWKTNCVKIRYEKKKILEVQIDILWGEQVWKLLYDNAIITSSFVLFSFHFSYIFRETHWCFRSWVTQSLTKKKKNPVGRFSYKCDVLMPISFWFSLCLRWPHVPPHCLIAANLPPSCFLFVFVVSFWALLSWC